MYIELNKTLINTTNLQKAFINEKRIVLQYLKDNSIITDSISYEDIRENINEEKQIIDKDFEKLQKYLINDLEAVIEEQKQYILELEKYKSDLLNIKYLLQMKTSKSRKIKMIGDLIDE